MTTITPETDWRKQAAAASQNDADIEKAFLDQAWLYLQSKAAPLMKSPYRVGFEIVYRNEGNNRLVGIFVFRIGEGYLFAPVFFLNGSIKGTDLLHRVKTKRFVLLNPDWCNYLIQLATPVEGEGVPPQLRQQTHRPLKMEVLTGETLLPYGSGFKYARARDVAQDPALDAAIAEFTQNYAVKLAKVEDAPQESILRKFILNHGKRAAIKVLAKTAQENKKFARALFTASSPDNYMPDVPPEIPPAPEYLLTLRGSPLRNTNLVKKASPKEVCQGYQFEDLRKQASADVYEDRTRYFETVQAAGVYDLLTPNGETRRCFVAEDGGRLLNKRDGYNCVASRVYSPQDTQVPTKPKILVDLQTKASCSTDSYDFHNRALYGTPTEETKSFLEGLPALGSVQSGKCYRIYDTDKESLSEPFLVKSVGKNELGLIEIERHGWSQKLVYNPDFADYDPDDGIYGKTAKVVEVAGKLEQQEGCCNPGSGWVKYDEDVKVGGQQAFNAFLEQHGMKRASVTLTKSSQIGQEAGVLGAEYLIKTAGDEKLVGPYGELPAKLHLMLSCWLTESGAEDVLKAANTAKDRRFDFFYNLPEEVKSAAQVRAAKLEKKAYNMRFNQWPEWYQNMNDEFSVAQEPFTQHLLQVQKDQPVVDRPRLGDAWKQESVDAGAMDTSTPMQLFGIAQQSGMGSLFEHGVVGELVKTFNSVEMVQSYLPDLEQALDRLGRIYFLFLWKPEDFAQAYGTNDQSSMEAQLLSQFKSLGELLLDLLQRAKPVQNGTPLPT